jgi:alpha-tubulin suppressor-like RCC1 family protein
MPVKLPVSNVRAFGGSTRTAMIDDGQRLYEAVESTVYGEREATFEMTEHGVASASDQCFVKTSGRVACWRPVYKNPRSTRESYEASPNIDDAVQIASHRDNGLACVRDRDGHVSCFNPGSSPYTIPITNTIDLAVTDLASCAIRADRSLWCWGSTQSSVFSPRPVPVDVAPQQVPVGEVVAMSLARDTICAVRTHGTVACWGRNDEGQLGDGTFMTRTRPADVLGIRDAIDVYVGHEFACALHRTGEVSCWGATDRGQIGTFATKLVPDPTPVVWP